ncbi:HAD family phosphatase [Ahrensia sp. R2A130]|uniref:HAD family hydrolase n=1 Tax=Ahrensia sp. R2A130 TaxID=744979 RepID=UPI0001E0A482|nr:HAD-IA family hydrolase [Ahrensia sp. R2A130]EFL88609.1 protein CbbY, chromosomal [Ahrensia sp. R2A130]
MTLSAILFGSIGTLVETSEHQRAAFNRAFRDSGLDWNWDQNTYRELLSSSGGAQRITSYAKTRGEEVDANEVHRLKTQHFNSGMEIGGLKPRPGVLEIMRWAAKEGVKTAFVTSTSRDNIEITFKALGNTLTESDFNLVTNAAMTAAPKPAPDIYNLALEKLGISASEAVAVEDTATSLQSPLAAQIATVAFPGANSLGQNYGHAAAVVDRLSVEVITSILLSGDAAGADDRRVAAG